MPALLPDIQDISTLSTCLHIKRKKTGKRINNDVWIKPKWMRKKTYARLRKLYRDLEEKVEIANFYNLRNNPAVDKLFARYGSAMPLQGLNFILITRMIDN